MSLTRLVSSFALVFLAAFAGSAVTTPNISGWYQTLNKPTFNPPNYIFGPVWTLLYILMAISFYLVWNSKSSKIKKRALQVFCLQLFLNLLWSFVFFGLHQIFLSVVVIIALFFSILYTVILFKKISKTAAYLLIPYILWVSFASVLNICILLLN